MIVNCKFLSLSILIMNFNCHAAASVTRDRGGWDKTTITKPADKPTETAKQNYISRKEIVFFKSYADLDVAKDTYTITTETPVVRYWEEGGSGTTSADLTSNLTNHMREVQIAYYASRLTDLYTARPFDASEKIYLAELIDRLATT